MRRFPPLAFTVVAALLLFFQASRSAEAPPLQVELEFADALRAGVPNTLNCRVLASTDLAAATPKLVLPPQVEMTGGPPAHDVKLTGGVPATFAYLVSVTGEGDFAIAFEMRAGVASARAELGIRAAADAVQITRPSARIERDPEAPLRAPGLLRFQAIETTTADAGRTSSSEPAPLVDLGSLETVLAPEGAARRGAERSPLVEIGTVDAPPALRTDDTYDVDLRCYQPPGWAGPIVASSARNTHAYGPDLYEGEVTYVDWAIANYDDEYDAEDFYACMKLDGTIVEEWYIERLEAGYAIGVEDAEYHFPYGWHELRVHVDCHDDVDEWDESNNWCYRDFEWKRYESYYPELECWQPDHWSGPIVASSRRGTNLDDELWEGEATYIDWAVGNYDYGNGYDAGPFHVCLKWDGQLLEEWFVDGGLQRDRGVGVEDAEYRFVYGWHELKLEVDCYGDVHEWNESNNSCYREFEWKRRNYPDLTCWHPRGWSGPIVASSVRGTNTDGPELYENEPTWIDWAIANWHEDYEGYAGPFQVCLTQNGTPLEYWHVDGGLAANYELGVEDAEYRFSYGWHQLAVEVDCAYEVDEWYEDNNHCYRDFEWKRYLDECPVECYTPGLKIGHVSGRDGQRFVVDLELESSPNSVDAFGLDLDYDRSMMRFLVAESGDLTNTWTVLDAVENTPGTITMGGFDAGAIPAGSSGSLFRLQFEIDCGACSGGTKSSFHARNLVNDVEGWDVCCGSFTYSSCVADGDIDNDGSLTPGDGLCAFQTFLNGQSVPSGCDVAGWSCERTAADVDCDESVTPEDGLRIFQRWLDGRSPESCFAGSPSRTDSRSPAVSRDLFDVATQRAQDADLGAFSIPVTMKGFSGEAAFGFELSFDPATLRFDGLDVGGAARDWKALDARESRSGRVIVGGFDPDGLKSGDARGESVTIAELRFTKLADDASMEAVTWISQVGRSAAGTGPASGPLVSELALGRPSPNPLRGGTTVQLSIPTGQDGPVSVSVHDVSGRLVRTLVKDRLGGGVHMLRWDARSNSGAPVTPGVYFLRVDMDAFRHTQKMTVVN